MLVPHYELQLSAAEQQALAALQRAGKTPQQTVRRATLLLLAHKGLSKQAIADRVGTSRNLVQKWRKRFALYEPSPPMAQDDVDPIARLAALQDLPRSGCPPDCSPAGPAHRHRRRLPRDLSELAPKIHATAMDRGFGSFGTTIFCVKE